jgi:SAM-dependent methyltransferase
MDSLSGKRLISNSAVLHFAPEAIVSSKIGEEAGRYTTADLLRDDCDLKLDMSNMPSVANGSFDVVVAFDVLEHVPDFHRALAEIHRVLVGDGYAILTVPQKDQLAHTHEDASMVTAAQREACFGQWDHLRIFGDDFVDIVRGKGFSVIAVDKSMFAEEMVRKSVLAPPLASTHPLATNHRRIFFCRKALA